VISIILKEFIAESIFRALLNSFFKKEST